MRHDTRILGLGTAIVGVVLAGATSMSAAAASPGAATVAKPAGYTIVNATFSLPNGSLVPGAVSCPKKNGVQTVPLSGGALIDSSSLAANINSSYPSATAWHAEADNLSGTATIFSVYAVCANKLTGYIQQQSKSVSNPAGTQNGAGYLCPKGDVLTGGGALSATASAQINLNSSWPSGTSGWYVYMNNASTTSTSFTVFHVCAKLNVKKTDYMLVAGTPVANPAGHDDGTSVFCPGGLSTIGGGIVSGAGGGLSTDMNTTFPFTGGWGGDENNGGTANPTLTGYVLCAS
jgi:hypothetical protein